MLFLLARMRLLWAVRSFALRLGRLFLDSRVSPGLKLGAALAALLIVSPINVLGDIPVLGMLDDAAMLGLLGMVFMRMCPPDVVAQYSRRRFASAAVKNVTPSR
ncbi:MAG: hypothetical protein DLM53_09175 [Candidatus Eremiobacter antarcticus]|nr:DUF1232 domain-containing protein [Candidatus Eremiobacteraeota bacterium]MBC5807557.1 DUF1232 domain-containing protein [Candidatus Eremiobacteraeota bacterium]PZR61391.1 MAG: hypothetical protein DLM53_09175 [Candidatus Eremiobacter sp. RRmetagenome_bin22]